MQTIAASEARGKFAQILERVHYAKDRIAIGRRGKPFAAVVPIEDLELLEDPGTEALRQSEARLRALMDHAPIEIFLKDAEGRYVQVNRHCEELWGVKNDEVCGKLPAEVHPEAEITGACRAQDMAVLESGQVIEQEDENHPGDGLRTRLTVKFPIRDAAGEVTGLGGVAIDTSERKRTEDVLRKTQSLFEETERLAKLGHWEWDEVADRCTFCSEELARLHGLSVEAFLRQATSTEADARWAHTDDRERVERTLKDAMSRKLGFDIEYRLLPDGGEQLDVREVAVPVVDDGGALIRSIGFVQDIADRKRAEAALQESEARFRDFADATSDWFWEMDEACRFSYFSDRFTEITGVPHEVLLGKTREETGIPELDPMAWQQHLSDLAARRSFRDFRHPRTLADGRVVHLSINGKAIFDAAGRFRGYRGTGSDITERKEAEDAVRESEALLKQAAQMARMGHWVWDDVDNRLAYCSEELAALDGVTVEDYFAEFGTREAAVARCHPEDRARYDREIRRAEAQKRAYDLEYREIGPDGETRFYRERGEPVLDERGNLISTIGMSQDITGQKRTEEALRRARDELEQRVEARTAELRAANAALTREIAERKQAEAEAERSRALLAAAVEALDEGFVIFDADDRMVLCNSKYREIYRPAAEAWTPGVTLETVARDTARHCLGIEDEAEIETWVRRRSLQHKSYGLPFEQTFADGRWIRVAEYALPNGWSVGTRTDLTDLKRAEEALRTSAARLGAIFDNSPATISLKDLDGRYQTVNRRFKELFGKTEDEIIARTPHDLFAKEIADSTRDHDRAALEAGQAIEREERILGETHQQTLLTIKFPIVDDDGRITGIGSMATDITAQKATERQLRQAQKMEAVGQLTGGVAHDFNNLLAVIMGNAEFLGADLGEEERSVAAIIKATTRGAELTQRLLAFSRQQPLHPQAIDLGGLVGGMAGLIRRTLGETIAIETEFAEDLWPARADPGQVENALLNLSINARDAMPEGGRLVIETANARLGEDESDAAAHMEVTPGNYVMLAVRDTGGGMDPEVLERVYEPFFTTKRVGEGSGLGLSMVYGFAKQSGGDVRIHSEPGQGTSVRLYLPRHDEGSGKPGEGAAAPPPRGKGETVLVVEDDPDVRGLADQLLADLGYRVFSAADAQAGLSILRQAPRIDLLLSDVVLPGAMSGPEFAAEVRRHDPAIKFLFMSGYAEGAANRRQALPQGADLLDKPFRKRELARKMRAVLDRPGPQELRATPGPQNNEIP